MNCDLAIRYTIGSKEPGSGDTELNEPEGVAFDEERGELYVADVFNHRVQVFNVDDGSLVASIVNHKTKDREKRSFTKVLYQPRGIAIDLEHGRLFVSESWKREVQVFSLRDRSFVRAIGTEGDEEGQFDNPRSLAIDSRNQRLVVADTDNDRVQSLALPMDERDNDDNHDNDDDDDDDDSDDEDGPAVAFVAGEHGDGECEFEVPFGVAVDNKLQRVVVSDTNNHRLQVLSSNDGSFLFEFGERGTAPGQLLEPSGVCIDSRSRILVVDSRNHRLQAFTSDGEHISSLALPVKAPRAMALDERRGILAFTAANQVYVINANGLLPGSFAWNLERHRFATKSVRQVVSTTTMIRSLCHDNPISRLPNELLFAIYQYLC